MGVIISSISNDNLKLYFQDKELKCIDLNTDCNQQICNDYPYTAKQRCAKTCGFRRKQQTDGGTTNVGDRYSFTDKSRSRTPESDLSSSRGLYQKWTLSRNMRAKTNDLLITPNIL